MDVVVVTEAARARRNRCGIPEEEGYRPKWTLAVEMLDELAGHGLRSPVLVADAGYGDNSQFRAALDERDITYSVQLKGEALAHTSEAVPVARQWSGTGRCGRPPASTTPVYADEPVSLARHVAAAGREAALTVTWREGSKGALWPLTTPVGRVLVTTRRTDSALERSDRRVLKVEVFTPPDESLAYLDRKLVDHGRLRTGAEQLAAELGHLPLALAQAVAYMVDQELTCEQYSDLLADRRNTLRKLAPDVPPDDQPGPLDAIWSLSVEVADRLSPEGLAHPLLALAVLLDPAGVPTSVFSTGAVIGHLVDLLGRAVNIDDTHSAMRCLHKFSLASFSRAEERIRVHTLVQRATRESMDPDALMHATTAAADALIEAWPGASVPTAVAPVMS